MRSRISIRGCVCPSVGPSVRPSVCRSVRPSHTSWISEKWAHFEQNSIRNMKLCHLKDNSETSTRANRQNASVVRTLFDLFSHFLSRVRWPIGTGSDWACLDGGERRMFDVRFFILVCQSLLLFHSRSHLPSALVGRIIAFSPVLALLILSLFSVQLHPVFYKNSKSEFEPGHS